MAACLRALLWLIALGLSSVLPAMAGETPFGTFPHCTAWKRLEPDVTVAVNTSSTDGNYNDCRAIKTEPNTFYVLSFIPNSGVSDTDYRVFTVTESNIVTEHRLLRYLGRNEYFVFLAPSFTPRGLWAITHLPRTGWTRNIVSLSTLTPQKYKLVVADVLPDVIYNHGAQAFLENTFRGIFGIDAPDAFDNSSIFFSIMSEIPSMITDTDSDANFF